jgi:hypothetical protein
MATNRTMPGKLTYSSKLGENIIIARDQKEALSLKDQPHVVYTEAEASMLKGQSLECITMCHQVKKIFGGFIESITPTEQEKGENNDNTSDKNKEIPQRTITAQYLREHPECVFVFGDNTIRRGRKGAAALRDEKNAYGFITKKFPSHDDRAHYKLEEYAPVLERELRKLTTLIEASPQRTFLLTPLGSGLANRYGIYEKMIRPALTTIAEKYPNAVLLPKNTAEEKKTEATPQPEQ